MDPLTLKRSCVLVCLLSFCVILFAVRLAYIVSVKGGSCDSGEFCFFPKNHPPPPFDVSAKTYREVTDYYSSIFQDLIADGYLSPNSRALCVGSVLGEQVLALREIGVKESIGIAKKASPPLVLGGIGARHQPFDESTFDFEFSGDGIVEQFKNVAHLASEICRTLKPGGFLVVHTKARDAYSLHSLLDLFNCSTLVKSRDIDAPDSPVVNHRQIILLKELKKRAAVLYWNDEHKHDVVKKAEPLIEEEPSKPPRIAMRRNVRYLTSVVDISFKNRYIYIDVGAKSYGSSIGSWFKKLYPKQNKRFEIYAVEADKAFHNEYRKKKGVTLLPFAAWIRNETLFFEITREPRKKNLVGKRRGGVGRIQTVQSSMSYMADEDRVHGFDFAEWVKKEAGKNDFVVMKMDAEGTEFHLIDRLIENGAISLIDEMFLKCHYYNTLQRSSKHKNTYAECLQLVRSLRMIGVFVHQWW